MIKIYLLYFIVGYTLLAMMFYFMANHVIFQPPVSTYKDSSQIIKLKTRTGITISAIYLSNEQATYTILVNHGNAEDLGTILPFLKEIEAHGYSVFAYDYAGYGTSEGSPSEKEAYADVEAAYDYLTNTLNISPKKIIIYGHSLGAAMAIDIASKKPVAGLILESPFVTAYRVVTRYPIFPFDRFDNLEKIKNIFCPILIIHGTSDYTIPYWHGVQLYKTIESKKQLLSVDKAGHNDVDLVAGEAYWQTIQVFIDQEVQAS